MGCTIFPFRYRRLPYCGARTLRYMRIVEDVRLEELGGLYVLSCTVLFRIVEHSNIICIHNCLYRGYVIRTV